ncbi:endo-1,4-beta-xylanase [Clostridia bacterium]|nr:endo-1,4-beta-xylanase [Clostridia bacterium]
MIHEKIDVSVGEYGAFAYTYLLENSPEIYGGKRTRPLVIICPGGGYEFTSDREAEPVAIAFNALGFHAMPLRYSVAPARYPTALLQLNKTMEFARKNEENWNVSKIIVAGFSAGGHLAASLGVLGNPRPDGLILAYPVITSGEFAHEGSMVNLFGEDKTLREDTSLEKLVTPETPPAFIWHTGEDSTVPVENSLLFANALRKAGVPFELHIYQHGEHGLSLATEEVGNPDEYANIPAWVSLAGNWIKNL